jgi:hypothetical protein
MALELVVRDPHGLEQCPEMLKLMSMVYLVMFQEKCSVVDLDPMGSA